MPRGMQDRISRLLERPGIETVVLKEYRFVADPAPRPRLTLVLPSISKTDAFGGLTTSLDFFLALARRMAERDGGAMPDLRILTEEAYDPADDALPGHLAAAGLHAGSVAVASLKTTGLGIPTRPHDVFVVFNWWIALNIEPVLHAQAAHFALPPMPKLYLIQEYEPWFYSFSSAHLLALHAFNSSWPLWAVFNSAELVAYYRDQGNVCTRSYAFEPRMPAAVRAFQSDIRAEEKARIVLVYGRPVVKRNCFSILEAGLRLWAEGPGRDSVGTGGWRIVSAGLKHPDVPLGAGARLESLGKLSLEEYGRLLRQAAVGISLMASPHPSYPPLEMAHFGIRTITNRYRCKEPAARHDNLIALPDILPATLAATLAETVAAFEADPGLGPGARSHMPDYLSDKPYECLDGLAGDLVGLLAARRAGSGPGSAPAGVRAG